MKTLDFIQLFCLATVFAMAGISAIFWYGHGFNTWCWQVLTMIYSGELFIRLYKETKSKN